MFFIVYSIISVISYQLSVISYQLSVINEPLSKYLNLSKALSKLHTLLKKAS
ncbi:hypothetical protein BGS_0603 [Beggiatoa sp. SS]|nr:hypothetical protein BGS_0603 [Beggiatoa sp. SS]